MDAFRRDDLFVSGHRACPGCGVALAVRHVLQAAGRDIVVVTPTGCLETFTSPYGFSPWRVPWIHHLFENGPSVASGVNAALRARGNNSTRVIVIGGDGATFDIGFGALSGMLERGDDVLYICVDNEGYMNTGGQRSAATPLYAATTTSPSGRFSAGKPQMKKDMPSIVAAHRVRYVATASVAYLKDLQGKVRKAMGYQGPRYIQVDTPCTSVWGFQSDQTIEIARLGIECGLVPIFEMIEGNVVRVRKIRNRIPVESYLRAQARFRHLFHDERKSELEAIQSAADRNIKKFDLLGHDGPTAHEESTAPG